MARDKRMKTNNGMVDMMHQVFENTSQCNKPGQERSQVCETMNQHNKWQQEKMARDKRMKTNNDVVDAMHQVSKNMSQLNEPGQERNQVCKTQRGTRCARMQVSTMSSGKRRWREMRK